MDYRYITYETSDRMGIITLNRADKRNALNVDFVSEIKDALRHAESDESVRVIVLKAKGAVFSAGADLKYLEALQKNTLAENYADSRHLMELYKIIYYSAKIVIAQVEGHALAGGCGLAAVCDFCFAVPEAKFGYTEAKIGFIPAIVMVFLLRKIGEGRTKALLLSGRLISSDEAKGIGLINEVIDPRDMDVFVRKFATRLSNNNSANSLAETKRMIAHIQDMNMDEALDFAAQKNAEIRQSDDCKKGIGAFLKKETINW